MNELHDPEDEFNDELDWVDGAVESAHKAIEERNNGDYDGVVGIPTEDWVPGWAVSFFKVYRNRLLDVRGYTHEALLILLERYRKEYFREEYIDSTEVSNFSFPATYPNGENVDPHCFQDEIGFLAWLKWCVDQDEEIGLVELSGENGLLGFHRRKSLSEFGTIHGEQLHEESEIKWKKWKEEKNRLVKINPHLARNKSELARKIKENLKLTYSVSTIRQRI